MDDELERIWNGPLPLLRHYIANCLKRWVGETKEWRICKKKTVYYKNNCSNLKNTFHQKSDYKQHYKTFIGMNLESPHTRIEILKV
jgi:hypothetical protein